MSFLLMIFALWLFAVVAALLSERIENPRCGANTVDDQLRWERLRSQYRANRERKHEAIRNAKRAVR